MSNRVHQACQGNGCNECSGWGYLLACRHCHGRGFFIVKKTPRMCVGCEGLGWVVPRGVRPEWQPVAHLDWRTAEPPDVFNDVRRACEALDGAFLHAAARALLPHVAESNGLADYFTIIRAYVRPS